MPGISVVIPTFSGVKSRLLDALQEQTRPPDEIEVVRGVKPASRARNQGIARTSGDIVIFIDDDALPAQKHLIESLAAPLLSDRGIGATGSSRLIPPDSSIFQRWTARQVARIENPVVHTPRETSPSRKNYFYADITTTCCALRREVLREIRGFDDRLIHGEDSELFIRLSNAGYRLRLVPDLWVYHPAPASMRALLRKHFGYGLGYAQFLAHNPEYGRASQNRPVLYLLFRSLAFLPHIFLPFSFAEPTWRLGFKPLKALASYASALGYAWERVRIKRQQGEQCGS